MTDMLAIAQADALIASGSAFSLWGSFIRDLPRICHPGQSPARGNTMIEPAVFCDNETAIPECFIARLGFSEPATTG